VLDRPVPVGAAPDGLVVSPDGARVYVVNRGDGTVSVLAVE
jgi:DNA-binding beta-propeller fold protein YncE